jgi:hypothetical protein
MAKKPELGPLSNYRTLFKAFENYGRAVSPLADFAKTLHKFYVGQPGFLSQAVSPLQKFQSDQRLIFESLYPPLLKAQSDYQKTIEKMFEPLKPLYLNSFSIDLPRSFRRYAAALNIVNESISPALSPDSLAYLKDSATSITDLIRKNMNSVNQVLSLSGFEPKSKNAVLNMDTTVKNILPLINTEITPGSIVSYNGSKTLEILASRLLVRAGLTKTTYKIPYLETVEAENEEDAHSVAVRLVSLIEGTRGDVIKLREKAWTEINQAADGTALITAAHCHQEFARHALELLVTPNETRSFRNGSTHKGNGEEPVAGESRIGFIIRDLTTLDEEGFNPIKRVYRECVKGLHKYRHTLNAPEHRVLLEKLMVIQEIILELVFSNLNDEGERRLKRPY